MAQSPLGNYVRILLTPEFSMESAWCITAQWMNRDKITEYHVVQLIYNCISMYTYI